MLRITTTRTAAGTTLTLEGRLVGPWVDELAHALEACGDPAPTLNLADTTFVDACGRKLLAAIRARGGRLVTAGPLMEALVNGEEQ